LRFGELIDEPRRGEEPYILPLLKGSEPQGGGKVRLAGSAVAHEQQFSFFPIYSP